MSLGSGASTKNGRIRFSETILQIHTTIAIFPFFAAKSSFTLILLFFLQHDGFSRTHLNGEQTPLTLPEFSVKEQPDT